MANSLGNRGLPRAVVDDVYLAPVHLNVGGTTYTSTLTTLTKYPDSKLAKLFNGTLAITLDPVNRHYFLDVDGSVFTHILNFLRYDKLVLPEDFNQLPLLKEQVEFFELEEMLSGMTNRESVQTEQEIETEDEVRHRRRRKRKTVKRNRDKEEAATGQRERENRDDNDIVVMDTYSNGSHYSIKLYSSAKISLEEPIVKYSNLKTKAVGVGHCFDYSFNYNASITPCPSPFPSEFDPCITQFTKQLLDKGYELSTVARTGKEYDFNKYFFTRLN